MIVAGLVSVMVVLVTSDDKTQGALIEQTFIFACKMSQIIYGKWGMDIWE